MQDKQDYVYIIPWGGNQTYKNKFFILSIPATQETTQQNARVWEHIEGETAAIIPCYIPQEKFLNMKESSTYCPAETINHFLAENNRHAECNQKPKLSDNVYGLFQTGSAPKNNDPPSQQFVSN